MERNFEANIQFCEEIYSEEERINAYKDMLRIYNKHLDDMKYKMRYASENGHYHLFSSKSILFIIIIFAGYNAIGTGVGIPSIIFGTFIAGHEYYERKKIREEIPYYKQEIEETNADVENIRKIITKTALHNY